MGMIDPQAENHQDAQQTWKLGERILPTSIQREHGPANTSMWNPCLEGPETVSS